MQNVIYAVIGVILTVAGMYMVSPSINKSSEAINAGLVSTEAGQIKTISKIWVSSVSVDGTVNDFDEIDVSEYSSDFQLSGDKLYSHNIKNYHNINIIDNNTYEIVTTCENEEFAELVRKNYKDLGDVTDPGTGVTAKVKIKV